MNSGKPFCARSNGTCTWDRAAAWHAQWKRHAPEEARTRIYPDTIEGTAQYFDEAASVRAHAGPDASRDQIDAAYRSLVGNDYGFGVSRVETADAESYQVGALAGILLEQTGNRDWKARAMRGVPPAEALLRNRAQIPAASAPEVERLLETRVLPRAQAARGVIEPLLQRLKAPGARFLAFAAHPNLKNYSSGGLFRVDAYPDAARTRNGYLDYADDNLTLAKVPVSRQVTDEEGRVILCGPSMFGAQP